jgi:hypothetical protein
MLDQELAQFGGIAESFSDFNQECLRIRDLRMGQTPRPGMSFIPFGNALPVQELQERLMVLGHWIMCEEGWGLKGKRDLAWRAG